MRKKGKVDETGDKAPNSMHRVDFYEKVLPLKLFELIGITPEKPVWSQQAEISAAVLNLNIAYFMEITRKTAIPEIYALVNEIVSACIPVIEEKNGIVEKFLDAGVQALFQTEPEEALRASVRICEILSGRVGGWNYWDSFSIGIAYGTVIAGMVGYEKRMSPLTLSIYTGLAAYLQNMAFRFGAKILVTGAYVTLLKEFETQYNYRFLGFLYIKNGGIVEKLYDVFDGDAAEVRNRKRKTKRVFEKGVAFFTEGNYEKARYFFVEVLKTDGMDKAAKQYIQLCEKGGRGGDSLFVETY